jgi:hypothetical protein
MKENEIYKKFVEKFIDKDKVFWKAPCYQKLSWDIFGIFDIIVIDKYSHEILFAQLTTLTNLSHRRKKIQDFFTQQEFVIPNSYIFAYDPETGSWKIEKQ